MLIFYKGNWIEGKNTGIKILEGLILKSVEIGEHKEAILFTTSEGRKFLMHHDQDCCEAVFLEDVCGEINSILNKEVVLAEEVSRIDENAEDSGTWTFYNIATVSGLITLRWYGESNGYYSEAVDFVEIDKDNEN